MQIQITPAAGKRLIAHALAKQPRISKVLKKGTIVIIAGTTNGYLAEEILKLQGDVGFSKEEFYRGLVLPPDQPLDLLGRMESAHFPGDVVIIDGEWVQDQTIFDIVEELQEGDIIFKGVNAVNYPKKQAAVYIGHPQGGTICASLPAVVGRRVELILPVGLEKRVYGDLNQLAIKLNKPNQEGPRLLPVPGEIYTELEALKDLCGAEAEIIAAGGVNGAEGTIWLNLIGNDHELDKVLELLEKIIHEPSFHL
jgi:hypothetical protein